MTIFVGREADLKQLHGQLQPGSSVAISAVSGMGGIGKTELALQYAYHHLNLQTYPGGICWLRARQEIGTQIVSFAQTQLEIPLLNDLELAEKVAVCWRQWWDGNVLVIFDDVQNYAEIQPFLPPQRSQFRVLLTTRLKLQSPVQDFEIRVLPEEKALELLRAIVTDGRIDQDLATTKQICQWLGYLPLGIELVGRYMVRKPGTSLATLWQRLQDNRLKAEALKKKNSEMTATLGVVAAFDLSWDVLDEPAKQLAALLSLFALAEIPWTLVEACYPEEDAEAIEDLRDESLLNLHLLERTGEGLYQLHQLLREFFAAKRSQMAEADVMKQTLCRVMVAVGQQIPPTPTLTIIEQVTPAIPHLKEVATTLAPWLTDEALPEPANRLAWFYAGQSAYADALRWHQTCLTAAETRFGADHPDVAAALNNLANLHYAQGRYGEAEPLYLRALASEEQHLGTDHLEVATTLNNLAELYRTQERYGEAELLCLRARAIGEQQLGADHPDVAATLNNLANLYYAQGRYGEAEPLYLRALASGEQHLGVDHPNVATWLHNLAELYKSQGRYGEAEPLYLRALAILFEKLGNDHPNTQTGRENFLVFLLEVMHAGQTGQLSDHPVTQDLLRQIQMGDGNA